jgi:hypothetical protein
MKFASSQGGEQSVGLRNTHFARLEIHFRRAANRTGWWRTLPGGFAFPGGRSFAGFEGAVGLTFSVIVRTQRTGSTRINPCLGFA